MDGNNPLASSFPVPGFRSAHCTPRVWAPRSGSVGRPLGMDYGTSAQTQCKDAL
jgi:hypothetical protein